MTETVLDNLDTGWDRESNSPEPSIVPLANGSTVAISGSGMAASSGYYNYLNLDSTNINWTSSDILNTVSIGGTTLNYSAPHTHIQPLHISQPDYICPVSFDFTACDWKYTWLFILSLFLSPFMILYSKLTGKVVGFKIWNRPTGEWDV